MSHPVTIIGAIIALGGWAFLLFGVGTNTPIGEVANLHATAIAQSVITFGYMLVIAGLITEIGNRLLERTETTISTPVEEAPITRATDQELATRAAALRAKLDKKPVL